MKLVIGNKNYSSWSLRPWLLLRHAGIDFVEERISFNAPDFTAQVQRYSPVGKVPVLVDGEIVVWDSLAIVEYVAEKHAPLQLWPASVAQRARARALCAEMHSGFGELRTMMSMNVTARLPGRGWTIAVQRDIDRISEIWTSLRASHAAAGPFLFGHFTVVDAFFAPVVFRFNTYEPELSAPVRAYMETMLALPAMQAWAGAAAQENEFVLVDEPYRAPPA